MSVCSGLPIPAGPCLLLKFPWSFSLSRQFHLHGQNQSQTSKTSAWNGPYELCGPMWSCRHAQQVLIQIGSRLWLSLDLPYLPPEWILSLFRIMSEFLMAGTLASCHSWALFLPCLYMCVYINIYIYYIYTYTVYIYIYIIYMAYIYIDTDIGRWFLFMPDWCFIFLLPVYNPGTPFGGQRKASLFPLCSAPMSPTSTQGKEGMILPGEFRWRNCLVTLGSRGI